MAALVRRAVPPTMALLMRHVISALVVNEPGVLSLVTGLFSARGFNIDSLVVGRTENPELSRMTVVCDADDNVLEQVRKQLAKLVSVVKVRDLSEVRHVERDLILIGIAANAVQRTEIIELVNLFRGKVVDISKNSLMVELSGPEEKIEAFVELIEPYGIKEMARTGVIAMPRGHQTMREDNSDRHQGKAVRKRSLNAPSAAPLPPS